MLRQVGLIRRFTAWPTNRLATCCDSILPGRASLDEFVSGDIYPWQITGQGARLVPKAPWLARENSVLFDTFEGTAGGPDGSFTQQPGFSFKHKTRKFPFRVGTSQ